MSQPGAWAAPYPEPYYAPGWVPPRPPIDGWAIAALVTALLGLGPVALVLALVALRRTRRNGSRGRGLAVAALVIGLVELLALVAVLVLVVLLVRASSPLPVGVQAPREAHVGQLVVGHCLRSLPDDGDVATVTLVPCDQPHEASVVSTYRFQDGAVWPGQAAADSRVARSCEITDDEAAAGARLVAWAPTQQGWSRGDRTGLCLLVGP